ncbi:translation initiation factor IF-2 [Candidatus Pacearchaeota archaeon]|nr:translation initiation factor IF-2 [Candidatus Pacearchaeota archaeon]
MKPTIRQPIVTVCGHVDHGKTSILDRIRQSSVQEGEAGGITQKISFSLYPTDKLRQQCPLIDKKQLKLDIPGFLFIDTPGHAAFTNLRKRGGSLADLAVLVIDINEGIKPQTSEVIQILKLNKTPFIIALNKIDNISAWKKYGGKGDKTEIEENINSQSLSVRQNFDEKYMILMGSLQSYGFDSDLFYKIDDFTKKIALVPCSAKTGEGIPELIMVLCGLSQKYLEKKLNLGEDAKGIILEIKKERDNPYLESILYDGKLSRQNSIAISNLDGKPLITRIRLLEEILPLSSKFTPKEKVSAATGLRMQIVEKADILPGMPFVVFKNNLEEIEKIFKQQITESLKIEKQGIIAKADSLGSLEALLTMLRQEKIPVVKAGIGNINKSDIINAKANLKINELDAVIVGFNVKIEEEATEIASGIKILTDEVIYKLIENLQKFREEKRKEIEKRRLMQLSPLAKIRVLHQYVFRNTSPAIFGIKVEAGKIIPRMSLVDNNNEKVGEIKNLQSENSSVNEAFEGQELAISIPGINFKRRMKETKFLYPNISESQFRTFKKNKDLLSSSEISLLQEIAEIKRKIKANWGM